MPTKPKIKSVRQQIFRFLDLHPGYENEQVIKAFPNSTPNTVGVYCSQWRNIQKELIIKPLLKAQKELNTIKEIIKLKKLDPEVLEDLVVSMLEKDSNPSTIRTAVEFYVKIKGNDPGEQVETPNMEVYANVSKQIQADRIIEQAAED